MKEYILLTWPESQEFIGSEYSFFSNDEKLDSSAYFVDKKFYEFTQKFPNKHPIDLEDDFKRFMELWNVMKN